MRLLLLASQEEEVVVVAPRKPRFRCLHGYRTSEEIIKAQINEWPESFLQRVDLVFHDDEDIVGGDSPTCTLQVDLSKWKTFVEKLGSSINGAPSYGQGNRHGGAKLPKDQE
ncbi:hypothetical protein CRG98_006137 [Punica granatum]|uniref:Uncharacterized protein n=1 Tax=Punica granatum TaxID=22663 RepID=A0A2I0L0B6_PUNGR|nr:hypothetical protein CRG98_006137 [Punica granatum]